MRCDVLLWADVCSRGQSILRAMVAAGAAAGVECNIVTNSMRGSAPWLMSWGLGHVERRKIIDRHLKEGGHLIGWDLGYWGPRGKDDPEKTFRLTLDADHPWRMIQEEPAERFDAQGIVLREDANPSGPILLAGLGRKAKTLYPFWEDHARRCTAAAHRGRSIEFRRKDKKGPPIEPALLGKSLVVCRHSNVAVDACIAGVPVECEDGAAYALYRNNVNPDRAARVAFLRSLAWWQWKISEATEAWKFIQQKLSA